MKLPVTGFFAHLAERKIAAGGTARARVQTWKPARKGHLAERKIAAGGTARARVQTWKPARKGHSLKRNYGETDIEDMIGEWRIEK